jgi:hypothetical protein
MVVIGNLLEFVIIPPATQTQCSEDQYLPQVHSGATVIDVDMLRNNLQKELEDVISRRLVGIKVLQPAKQLRNLVTVVEFDNDILYVDLSHLHLLTKYFSHDFRPAKLVDYWQCVLLFAQ